MIEPFQLSVSGRRLAGCLHIPDGCTAVPWAVLCHGLFSSMASEKFCALAQMLCCSGIAALRFDFSGCGGSSGDIADTTVTRRLQELEAVVHFAENHAALGQNSAVMGSSLGGFVARLFAARRRFKALSLWATPYDLAPLRDTIPPDDLRRLNPGFFTDAAGYRLDEYGTDTPTQIIHGSRDESVPVSHADKLFSNNNPRNRLIIIQGADHAITDPQHRQKALEECCSWFIVHVQGCNRPSTKHATR
jgi:alpha-beta hydrolase superfamily lysophospholipase